MTDRHENRCANTEALNRYLAEEDERAEQFEEFRDLIAKHLAVIDESIFHINNIAESFPDLDLDDEIRESILEYLPYKKAKR